MVLPSARSHSHCRHQDANHSSIASTVRPSLVAALLNLMRPTILLVAVALAASAFGLVLHNANLAGLAAALLLLSLARPAPAAE